MIGGYYTYPHCQAKASVQSFKDPQPWDHNFWWVISLQNKGTNVLIYGGKTKPKKDFICVLNIYFILVMMCLLHDFKKICRLIFPKYYQLLWAKNRLGCNSLDHTFFSWTYIFLERCYSSSKVHPHRDKRFVTKTIAIHKHFFPDLYAKQNFVVFYSWRQRHFGDVKMKDGEEEHTTR